MQTIYHIRRKKGLKGYKSPIPSVPKQPEFYKPAKTNFLAGIIKKFRNLFYGSN